MLTLAFTCDPGQRQHVPLLGKSSPSPSLAVYGVSNLWSANVRRRGWMRVGSASNSSVESDRSSTPLPWHSKRNRQLAASGLRMSRPRSFSSSLSSLRHLARHASLRPAEIHRARWCISSQVPAGLFTRRPSAIQLATRRPSCGSGSTHLCVLSALRAACCYSEGLMNLSHTVLQPGLVTEAAGSAYIEAGRTKVLCAVCVRPSCSLKRQLTCSNDSYGPKPTPPSAPFNPKARLNVEIKFAPFASGVRRFVPGKVRCNLQNSPHLWLTRTRAGH